MNAVKTPAEIARENSLLNDPLVSLLDPFHVECRRCKKTIKLSTKSAYDTFHWRNHRKRCLMMKKRMKRNPSRRPVSSPLKAASTTTTSPTHDPEPRRLQTPPLIDISDSDDSTKSPEARSPQSPVSASFPSSPQTSVDLRQLEVASPLDDCILQSHSESSTQQTRYHWQEWSWSQLKGSRFTPPSHYHFNDTDLDDEQEDEYECNPRRGTSQYLPCPSGPGRIVADLRHQEAAHALSMLSRSR